MTNFFSSSVNQTTPTSQSYPHTHSHPMPASTLKNTPNPTEWIWHVRKAEVCLHGCVDGERRPIDRQSDGAAWEMMDGRSEEWRKTGPCAWSAWYTKLIIVNSANIESQIFIPNTLTPLLLPVSSLLWINKLLYYQRELQENFNNMKVNS